MHEFIIYVPVGAPLVPLPVVILADDQDYVTGSTSSYFMPQLNALIASQGLQLRNFLVSMAWCCPSRVSLLTGHYL